MINKEDANILIVDDIEDKEKWVLINKKYSAIWPNITKKKRSYERP